MKKFFSVLLILLLIASCIAALSSCEMPDFGNFDLSKKNFGLWDSEEDDVSGSDLSGSDIIIEGANDVDMVPETEGAVYTKWNAVDSANYINSVATPKLIEMGKMIADVNSMIPALSEKYKKSDDIADDEEFIKLLSDIRQWKYGADNYKGLDDSLDFDVEQAALVRIGTLANEFVSKLPVLIAEDKTSVIDEYNNRIVELIISAQSEVSTPKAVTPQA
ncbi:MAG: hypothetical protein LBL82_02040 [Oscillospiraceae bacterium]|jgi:hypothetical protein|nr:hypothetical protein [Oscillospiraceae bacterium]